MRFDTGGIYHIYNRGNNKQTIFFTDKNYLFFLEKVKKFILPNCDMLAWCLMPNHFHFLIRANEISCQLIPGRPVDTSRLVESVRLTLSGYTKAINIQEKLIGNLFQQKTKSKLVGDSENNYSLTAFHYIHQNPVKAGLADRLEDWQYSSYSDYAGLRDGKLCDKDLAVDLLQLNLSTFSSDSYAVLSDEMLDKIFLQGPGVRRFPLTSDALSNRQNLRCLTFEENV